MHRFTISFFVLCCSLCGNLFAQETVEASRGLEGTLYDFEQLSSGKRVSEDRKGFMKLLNRFIAKGWDTKLFDKYYRSSGKIYFDRVNLPHNYMTAGIKLYNDPHVRGAKWCLHLTGKVKAPKTGTFRFVGYGDDYLVVRFNRENVFDYGFCQVSIPMISSWKEDLKWYDEMLGRDINKSIKNELIKAGVNIPPVSFYEYSDIPRINKQLGGLVGGKKFQVEEGKVYPIEIIVGEVNGGHHGYALLIEDLDNPPNKKDRSGSPIFPLFRTSDMDIRTIFPGQKVNCDQQGPVWEVVK